MAKPLEGLTTMQFLLERNRFERIDSTTAAASASTIIGRASRRLLTGDAGLQAGDVEGAFVAAYDAYRMAAEALLLRQGLRATGGDWIAHDCRRRNQRPIRRHYSGVCKTNL
jgi:hypothetical protein